MHAALQSVLCGAHSYRQQIRALVELEAQKIQAIKVCILGRNGWGVWMGSMVESSLASQTASSPPFYKLTSSVGEEGSGE